MSPTVLSQLPDWIADCGRLHRIDTSGWQIKPTAQGTIICVSGILGRDNASALLNTLQGHHLMADLMEPVDGDANWSVVAITV